MHTYTHLTTTITTRPALVGLSPNPTGYNLPEFRLFPSTLLLKNTNNKTLHLLCPEDLCLSEQYWRREITACQSSCFSAGMISPLNFYMKQSANIYFPQPEVWDSGQHFSGCVVTQSRVECRSRAVQDFYGFNSHRVMSFKKKKKGQECIHMNFFQLQKFKRLENSSSLMESLVVVVNRFFPPAHGAVNQSSSFSEFSQSHKRTS